MPYDRAAAVAEGDFFFAFPGDGWEGGRGMGMQCSAFFFSDTVGSCSSFTQFIHHDCDVDRPWGTSASRGIGVR
jgi:hypothetical protein